MFSVYVEDKNGLNKTCIFHDESIDLALKLISPQLELEDNSAGSFQFTMYPSNQGYGLIPDTTTDHVSILSSTVRIYREWTTPSEVAGNPPYWHKEEIWEGRPLTEDKDFYNARVIYCEGAFSYLNDICQPVKEYKRDDGGDVELIDYVNGVLSEYNKHAASNRQFDTTKTYVNPVGISSLCTLKDPVASVDLLPTGPDTKDYDVRQIGDTSSKIYYMYTTLTGWKDASKSIYHTMSSYYKTGGETTKDAIGGLVSTFGGHVKVVTIGTSRCLYYTANADPEDAYLYPEGTATLEQRGAQQEVTFGKNLLDLSKKRDGSTFFTVLLPVGAEIGSTPETVSSMCPNIIQDGTKITDVWGGCDIIKSADVAPYDVVSTYSREFRNEKDSSVPIKRKIICIDIPQDYNGYDLFLNTTSFLRNETDSSCDNNTYFYRLSDRSAEQSSVDMIGSRDGQGMDYRPYPQDGTTAPTPDWGSGTYNNHRLINMKALSRDNYKRQTIECERIEIPYQGLYTFMFSVGDIYAWIANRDNDNVGRMPMPDNLSWVGDSPGPTYPDAPYDLMYPNLYRAPYKRENYIRSGLHKIPKNQLRWHGEGPRDGHGANASTTPPYNAYGLDDCDIYEYGPPAGGMNISTANLRNAFFLDRFYPFRVEEGQATPVPNAWQNQQGVYDIGLVFTTGFTGHHVAKINVEPGRTYYLTTRVTNKGYPNVQGGPEDWIKESNQIFYASGDIKSKKYDTIYAWVIVAYKPWPGREDGYFEAVSYKLANQSDITTDLFMEEIKIPDAVFPERYVPETEDNWQNKHHLELWFTCDQCYINGCANLDPNSGPVGYEPELYILDKDVAESSNQDKNDYQDKVTVAPLQRPKTASNFYGKDPSGDNPAYPDNFGFPYEYVINREMYEKYGPIVKRSEYGNATTPEKLMEYVNLEMLSMTEDPSFEVSAADLKSCGVANCDTFRLLQKIKIETEPHGVDQRVTLTKISMDLADLSSNQYTFGYEPTSDLSAMKNGGES